MSMLSCQCEKGVCKPRECGCKTGETKHTGGCTAWCHGGNYSDPETRKCAGKKSERAPTTLMIPTTRIDLKDARRDTPEFRRMLDCFQKSKRMVVIAGAGMSVAAGIPDFRSATGLFKRPKKDHRLKSNGKSLFDASVYQTETSLEDFNDMIRALSKSTSSALPTDFHHLLNTLAKDGRLLRLYTQNVDGIDASLEYLHTEVPLGQNGPWPPTIQVHGCLKYMVCSKCPYQAEFVADLFVGSEIPACPECAKCDESRTASKKRARGLGWLRPRIALYHEESRDADAIGRCAQADIKARPDAIIVVSTTLVVPAIQRIARELCGAARTRKKCETVWLNIDPPPKQKDLSDLWSMSIIGTCDELAKCVEEDLCGR
jgi:NAD-dependent histone deacetylase SIR2